MIVTKIQFYAIELARNREGHNDQIRHNFKPRKRGLKKVEATNEATNQLSKEVECELQKILTGKHDSRSENESNDMERKSQVEFEARTLEKRDLPGVISHLKQWFFGYDDVNLGELSLGSVVTQSSSDSTNDEGVKGKNITSV